MTHETSLLIGRTQSMCSGESDRFPQDMEYMQRKLSNDRLKMKFNSFIDGAAQ